MNEASYRYIAEYIDNKGKENSEFASKVEAVKSNLGEKEKQMLHDYVIAQAQKMLDNKSGIVEDQTVFNWAYDFYHDFDLSKELPPIVKPAEKKKETDEQVVKVEEKTAQPALKKMKRDIDDELGQISLFD